MASTFYVNTVTHVEAEWANDTNTIVYTIFGGAQTKDQAKKSLDIGTLAAQAFDAVAIEGGFLENVSIGTHVPAINIISQQMQCLTEAINPTDVLTLAWFDHVAPGRLQTLINTLANSLGTMAYQNKNSIVVTGGKLDSVLIGANQPSWGKFSTLKALNVPTQNDDVVTLGWLNAGIGAIVNLLKSMAFQDATSVAITGGNIDATPVGQYGPSTGSFTTLRTLGAPSIASDVLNKKFFDDFLVLLKSMAFQAANAVAITGGDINGVRIGNTVPAISGVFAQLQSTGNPTAGYDVLNKTFFDLFLATLGSMSTQSANAVAISGGNINGTAIGNTTASTGRFTNVILPNAPTIGTHAANKDYVDSAFLATVASFGTMSLQNANNVNIIGGAINGTNIGGVTPGIGTFSVLNVRSNNPTFNLVSPVTTANAWGQNFVLGSTVKGGLYYATATYGTVAVQDKLFINSATEFVIRTNVQTTPVISATWGANSYLHRLGGRVYVGNVTSITAEKLQVVGGFSADASRVSQLTVNQILTDTDGANKLQVAGGARALAFNETVQLVNVVNGLTSVDLAAGNAIRLLVNNNTTISFVNQNTSSTKLQSRKLTWYIVEDLIGAHIVNFPSNVQWIDGYGAPNFNATGPSHVNIIEMWSPDDGVTWYASVRGDLIGAPPIGIPVGSVPVGVPVGAPVGTAPVGAPPVGSVPVGVPVGIPVGSPVGTAPVGIPVGIPVG